MNKTLITVIIIIFFAIQCRINPNNNQLNLIISGDPKSLDPAQSTDIRTGKICALLFDTLVRYGHSTDILPNIAKNWETINLKKHMLLYTVVIYVYVVSASKNIIMINVLYVEKNFLYHTKFIIKI